MKYREIKSIKFLTNFIQSFWEYETFSTGFEHAIIPDGYFNLIVGLRDNSPRQIKLTVVWIMSISIVIPRSTRLFGIQFKLLAAECIFQREIKSVLGTDIILYDAFWNTSNYQTSDLEVFVSEISDYLENPIKHFEEIDSRKLKLSELAYQRQNLSVEKLLKSVFQSSRQINRCFSQVFGFPLKLFLNTVRCDASYRGISKGILYPSGNYFNQTHFIRETEKYTEKTLRELSKNENVRFLQLATKCNE